MKNLLIPIVAIMLLAGCGNDDLYTLYRNGLDLKNETVDESARYYIASFNEPKDPKYNKANCIMTSEALNKEQVHYQNSIHSKIKITYWCEKGEYRK